MKLDDIELGGRSTDLTRIRYSGDRDTAQQVIGKARVVLGQLKLSMQFNNIMQDWTRKVLPDGTVIHASSIKGGEGLHDIDNILIVTPEATEEKMLKVMIYGYILTSSSGVYVELPSGAETGWVAKTSLGTDFQGQYLDDYDGYPDFGAKYAEFYTDNDLNTIDPPEFQIYLVEDELIEVEYRDPRPANWEEDFPYWPPYDPPEGGEQSHIYVEVLGGGANNYSDVYGRYDHHGFWIFQDYDFVDGDIALLNASTDFKNTLFMIPFGTGSRVYYDASAVAYENRTTEIFEDQALGEGEDGLFYPIWEAYSVTTYTMTPNIRLTNAVPAGVHRIKVRFNTDYFQTLSGEYELTLHTSHGNFKRAISFDEVENEETVLTIPVGFEVDPKQYGLDFL